MKRLIKKLKNSKFLSKFEIQNSKLLSFVAVILITMQFIPALAQTVDNQTGVDTSGYYRTIATMAPGLMSGAGQTLASQVQAANGNLTIINAAFQNAVQYAIENGDPAAAQEAFALYQNIVRPALERQFTLTDPENPNNLTTLNTVLQNNLAPTLETLNNLISTSTQGNSAGRYVYTPTFSGITNSNNQNGVFIPTEQNTQQLARVYAELLAMQGNAAARGITGMNLPVVNAYDMAEGNFNILNVIQGVRTITANNASGAAQATGAATILNSIGLDPNLARPLGAIAGIIIQGDQRGSNLNTSLGNVASGLPDVTSMVGTILNSAISGQGGAQAMGGMVKSLVTNGLISGIRNSLNNNNPSGGSGQPIALPAGMTEKVSGMKSSVAGAAADANGIKDGATSGVANTAGADAVAAGAAGASGNPAQDAAKAAAGGAGAACSAGAGGAAAQPAGAEGAGGESAGADDSMYAKPGETTGDYFKRIGLTDAQIKEAEDYYDLSKPATQVADLAPTGGTTGGTTGGDSATRVSGQYPGGVAPNTTTPNNPPPNSNQSVRDYILSQNGGDVADADATIRANGFDPNARASSVYNPTTGNLVAPSVRDTVGTTRTTSNTTQRTTNTPSFGDRVTNTVMNTVVNRVLGGGNSNTSLGGDILRNVAGMAVQSVTGGAGGNQSVGERIAGAVLTNVVTGAVNSITGENPNGGNNNYGGSNYGANNTPTIAPPTITPATLEVNLRTKFLEQMMQGSTSMPITKSNGTIAMGEATVGTNAGDVWDTATDWGKTQIKNVADSTIKQTTTKITETIATKIGNPAATGLTTLLNGGNPVDALKAAALDIGLKKGMEMLKGKTAEILNAPLAGLLGGAKGVPVQVQKGAYYSMVEKGFKNLYTESLKQTKIQDEMCRIQRAFEKSKYKDDPAGYQKAADAVAESDKQVMNQMKEAVIKNWSKEIDARVMEIMRKFHSDLVRIGSQAGGNGQDGGGDTATQNLLAARSTALNQALADKDAYFIKTLTVPGADKIRQRLATNPADLDTSEITVGTMATLDPYVQLDRYNQYAINKINKEFATELGNINAGGGFQDQTKPPAASGADPKEPAGRPDIEQPASARKPQLDAALDRKSTRGNTNTNTKEESEITTPTIPQETQQKLQFGSAATQGNQNGGKGNGIDWGRIALIGLAAYCSEKPHTIICGSQGGNNGGGGGGNPPIIVAPNLSMLMGTSTVNGMQVTGIAWGAEGVSSCRYASEWQTFGTGSAAATVPVVSHTVGSPASFTDTRFVYHPHVFKVYAERIRAGQIIADQGAAFLSKTQKTYPAPGVTNQTVVLQETAYIPYLVTPITEGDAIILHLDDQLISVPLVTDDTADTVARKLSVLISGLPSTNAFKQIVTAKHMQFVALPDSGKLIMRGDVLQAWRIADSTPYSIACSPAGGGAEINSTLNINFGSDTITR